MACAQKRAKFGLVYVAAENFLSRDIDKRWRDTFGFGLIHGFGFASALQEFGLPQRALIPALASFNIGVEIGQITIAAIVLPLVWQLRKKPGFIRRGVPALSAVVALAGAYWFLQRTILL